MQRVRTPFELALKLAVTESPSLNVKHYILSRIAVFKAKSEVDETYSTVDHQSIHSGMFVPIPVYQKCNEFIH